MNIKSSLYMIINNIELVKGYSKFIEIFVININYVL